jgi:L-alanine-DL-glutamate epimerase-like enolase superfamily enzyme
MERKPLSEIIRERYRPSGPKVERIPCYAGGGFYRGGTGLEALQSELLGYLDAGYSSAKIKVGGRSLKFDIERIEAAIKVLGSCDRLALDASCSFNRESALGFVSEINPYCLRWLEEPCEPEDFETYRAVSEAHVGLTAGGENIFSESELRNFLRHGPLPERTILQPDPPLAYGVGVFARMVEIATNAGIERENIIPHGGNMMSLHVAAGLDLGSAESYPGLFAEFGGFSDEVKIAEGFATVPQSPGVGFEFQPALFSVLKGLIT